MNNAPTQFLAYYLPQYHPIPENDQWWGKGFTEWTNVTKAKPLFKGHHQPNLPADLGFYDLRVAEVQEQQSKLALEYGVDGFIYYQYWFGNGKMLLEMPAENMLKNAKIRIPFCFCWANETWKGKWHGLTENQTIIEQLYLGEQDYLDYFNYLLPFFQDDRYIKVDGKPMFHIYRIADIPDANSFLNLFNKLAVDSGFEGIHFVIADNHSDKTILQNDLIRGEVGYDIFSKMRYDPSQYFSDQNLYGKLKIKCKALRKRLGMLEKLNFTRIYDYKIGTDKLMIDFPHQKYIPCVFPNWDNSPRSGLNSLIFKNAKPQAWENHLKKMVDKLKNHTKNPQTVIIKSWNEWAEGNHLEPDQKYGMEWLKVVLKVKNSLD